MPLYYFTKTPASKSKYNSMFLGFPEGTSREDATDYANKYFEGQYVCERVAPHVNPPRALCLQPSTESKPEEKLASFGGEDDGTFGEDQGIEPKGP